MSETPPPVPDRLYGRRRGHPLRARQQLLLEDTAPRLALDPADPLASFPVRPRELWLEVGFGGGEHTLAQIAAHPEAGLIACEVFENGICSLLTRLVPEGGEATAPLPPNLRLWTEDARRLLRELPEGALSRLFLMFPDPWPKARHAKRRFVHPSILPVLARAMRPGGEWRIATDDPTYQSWVAEVMGEQDLFERALLTDTRPTDWPGTRYEAKALREGRQPLYWSWRRRG
ncbi:MAG TPA: tRNA (guanine(46)-N(7))-methyltransferase TrmB [Roseomonas sp.]|nr:tRNA (guanine(46)-N(7))-methyltransferase TrmB [Roseomonas sp.]